MFIDLTKSLKLVWNHYHFWNYLKFTDITVLWLNIVRIRKVHVFEVVLKIRFYPAFRMWEIYLIQIRFKQLFTSCEVWFLNFDLHKSRNLGNFFFKLFCSLKVKFIQISFKQCCYVIQFLVLLSIRNSKKI